MKKPSYDSTSTYLFYIALFVVGLSVISFLLTLILKSNIYIDFTSKGWGEFIEFYKPQIAIAGVGLALFALWMTAERMKQTQVQINSITENNQYRNYQDHLNRFLNHFANDNIITMISEVNSIERSVIINSIYRFYYYPNHKEFIPRYNKESSQFLYDVMEPLVNFLKNRDNINRNDIDFIDNNFGLTRNTDYSHFFENIVNRTIARREEQQKERIYPRLTLFYHFKILIKLSGFEKFNVLSEDELVEACKNIRSYLFHLQIKVS